MIPHTQFLIPKLLSEYVHSRRADMSLPASEVLPFVVGPSDQEQQYPRVFFIAGTADLAHPKRMKLTITVELQTSVDVQNLETEFVWQSGLRYALADKAAFLAWLAARSEAQRTGFAVKHYQIEDLGMGIAEDKKLRGHRTDVVLIVRSDELAP